MVSKAAAEEVKTISINGSGQPEGPALDFDELTELIKCVGGGWRVCSQNARNPTQRALPHPADTGMLSACL